MPAQEPAPREVAFIHSTRMRMTTSCFDRGNETSIVLIGRAPVHQPPLDLSAVA